MIVAQRQERILAALQQRGTVAASDLSRALSVSTATVRRDLAQMESEGLLVRVHGGAQLASGESAFDEVMGRDADAKDRIAEAAAGMVSDGDTVLLDIGTTTARIAEHLKQRHVTVITTSLAAIDVLRDSASAELIAIGGSFRPNFRSFVGPLALDNLARIKADLAFLGCSGVAEDGSILDDISSEALIKKALMAAADRVVLVTVAAKFPGTGTLRIGSLEKIDGLVTEASANLETLALCARAGGEVVTV